MLFTCCSAGPLSGWLAVDGHVGQLVDPVAAALDGLLLAWALQ